MFAINEIKLSPFFGMVLAGSMLLAGCGQTLGTVNPTARQSQTVSAQATRPWSEAQVKAAIRSQLEKRYADYTVDLADLEVEMLPHIMLVYPGPTFQTWSFTAIEKVYGFAGLYQWNKVEGVFSEKTRIAKVERRTPVGAVSY